MWSPSRCLLSHIDAARGGHTSLVWSRSRFEVSTCPSLLRHRLLDSRSHIALEGVVGRARVLGPQEAME